MIEAVTDTDKILFFEKFTLKIRFSPKNSLTLWAF